MNNLPTTAQFLESTEGKKVLVIGDVMIDQYISGSVNRISPEAPVPILLHDETIYRPGGAANVALNIAGLQNHVWLVSETGQDEMGIKLLELMLTHQVHTELLTQSEQRMTTCKTRVMAGNQHLLRVDQERKQALDSKTFDRMLQQLDELLRKHTIDIAIMQDYNKGVLTSESIRRFLEVLQGHKVPIAVDPKFDHFYAYDHVAIFKPNLTELRASLPFEVELNVASLAKASDYVRSKTNCQIVMITLSDKGIFIDNGDKHQLIPAQKRLITDVCGAGDTVISVAALTYLAGFDLEAIGYWSGLCGTIVCQFPGVKPITKALISQ